MVKKVLGAICILCGIASNSSALRMAPFRMDTTRVAVSGGELCGVLTTSLYRTQDGKTPLVIIIPGSGPTDMNGNSIGGVTAQSYLMLARDFADRGISSYRYDKRGIGASAALTTEESQLSFINGVVDVKSIVAYFINDERFSSIILLGHSEGSLIGMLATTAPGVKKYISLAGPADNASTLLKAQLGAQLGAQKSKVFKQLDSLRKGQTVRDEDPAMAMLFRQSVQPYLKSWFKYTPSTEIKKLKVPVLIVNGTKDIQVPEAQAQKLKKALPKAKLLIVKDMNHVLKTVEGTDHESNIAVYSDEHLPLVYDFVEQVSDWIKQ
jgi:uncharacterized protein